MRRVPFVLALLVACDAPDARTTARQAADSTNARQAPAHHFEVDSAAYTLRRDGDGWTASIGYVFRNPLEDTIAVVQCNGHVIMDLQKRTPDGWDYVWRAMTNGCLSPPIEIPPRDSLAGRMEVWGAEPGHPNFPTFTTAELDGDYRMVWHQPRTNLRPDAANFGDTLSLEQRTTETFRMRRAP